MVWPIVRKLDLSERQMFGARLRLVEADKAHPLRIAIRQGGRARDED